MDNKIYFIVTFCKQKELESTLFFFLKEIHNKSHPSNFFYSMLAEFVTGATGTLYSFILIIFHSFVFPPFALPKCQLHLFPPLPPLASCFFSLLKVLLTLPSLSVGNSPTTCTRTEQVAVSLQK